MLTDARMIEIVGVAGAGKSTLAAALAERCASCRVAEILHTSAPSHWPYVAHGAPRLLSLLARAQRRPPLLGWDEVKLIVYVLEWERYLRARPDDRSGLTVLDQGPIFALACLLWNGNPATRTAAFRAWAVESLERWTAALDAVVVLVAPDDVLLERINRRRKPHAVKGRAASEALDVLDAHRRAYGEVLDIVERLGRPRVLRFDTAGLSPVEIAAQLVAGVSSASSERAVLG